MGNIFEKIDEILGEAEKAATLETASFGFPLDRIKIKSVHFGSDDRGHVGDELHPDEYIKSITRLHHKSWIIRPIKEARILLDLHSELIFECEKLMEAVSSIELGSNLANILERAKANINSSY